MADTSTLTFEDASATVVAGSVVVCTESVDTDGATGTGSD
jgi:hypothetical protein